MKVPVTSSFPLAVAIFVTANVLLAYSLRRFVQPALWITGVMLVLFPFLSDTSDWNTWFDWVKRYSVVIPAFLWAFLHSRPEHRLSRLIARALPWVLVVNILEAGLLELLGQSPTNGALIVIVALLLPTKWTQEGAHRQLGFRAPFWQLAVILCLGRMYVLNPQFENGTAGALLVISLASLLCLADRDSQNYVGWRLYTLYLLVLQDSIFPGGSGYLYPTWLHVENRVKLQGTPLAHAWLVLNVVVVAALLIPRARAWRAKAALAPAATG